jgi:Rho-binding antiterminator
MNNKTYKPIDCNMYDVLLEKATLKKECNIVFTTDEKTITTTAIIVDVYTKAKEEFALLNDGTIIRLDRIVSVDGVMINAAC